MSTFTHDFLYQVGILQLVPLSANTNTCVPFVVFYCMEINSRMHLILIYICMTHSLNNCFVLFQVQSMLVAVQVLYMCFFLNAGQCLQLYTAYIIHTMWQMMMSTCRLDESVCNLIIFFLC